jgi:L-rhamnose mutarotase
MIRKAFVMILTSGQADEYQRRHNPIWPELEVSLKEHGVHNYSIFLDRASCRLFAYVEIEDEVRWAAMAQSEVCRRWWAAMTDVMATNPDASPLATELDEMFHLD